MKPLFPYPAILYDDGQKKTLIITDLHIGYEYNLAKEGIYLPSQTKKILDKLIQILKEVKPNKLILLGDVKQAIPKIGIREWKDVPDFFEKIINLVNNITVILGNHDGDLEPLTPPSVNIVKSSGILIKNNFKIGLFHGHAWPAPEVLSADILVMGHVHPIVKFYDKFGYTIIRQVWMKIKCDGRSLAAAYLKHMKIKNSEDQKKTFSKNFNATIKDPTLIVIPAFNEALGGISVEQNQKKWIGPILKNCGANSNKIDLHLLDGTYLGAASGLPICF